MLRLSPTRSLTQLVVAVTFSVLVTSRITVCRLSVVWFLSCSAPCSVRHAAKTLKPLRSSCLASRFPRPESQPVIKMNLSWRWLTTCLSRSQRRRQYRTTRTTRYSDMALPGTDTRRLGWNRLSSDQTGGIKNTGLWLANQLPRSLARSFQDFPVYLLQ